MMRPSADPNSSSEPSYISRTTKIRQVMTLSPHTIGSDQKLTLAHKMMREYHLRHLPVLRAGELVGVLSERDLFFLESVAGVDVDIDAVSEAMTAANAAMMPRFMRNTTVSNALLAVVLM